MDDYDLVNEFERGVGGAAVNCVCAKNTDGTRTTTLCSVHATTDPCLTVSLVTGKRRKGTIRRGVCTNCGHRS